jgi:hypothetical protein
MKRSKTTSTTSEPEAPESASLGSLFSIDEEMDTQGLLIMEQDFGKGIAKKRILTTKGVSLKELYETSKP